MTKFVANLGLMTLSLLNLIGLYWFAFGLWPQNWWAFAGFGLTGILIAALKLGMDKDE